MHVNTETSNIEIVRQIYRDFLAGNIGAVLDRFDPDIDWSSSVNWPGGPKLPYAGPKRGVEAVADAFALLNDHVQYQRPMVESTIRAEGDAVLVTGADVRRDVRTGETTENRWTMVWKLRDERVVYFRVYQDTVETLDTIASLGL